VRAKGVRETGTWAGCYRVRGHYSAGTPPRPDGGRKRAPASTLTLGGDGLPLHENGKPLIVDGDDIFDRSGRHVARRRGDRVYGPDGRYEGTILGDRVVYRSTHSARIGPSFAPRASKPGTARADRVGSAMWGDEPFQD